MDNGIISSSLQVVYKNTCGQQ